MGRGLYPRSPDMRLPATQNLSDAELFHIIELRSSSAGHPTYRWIAQEFAKHLEFCCPWITPHLRVDRGEHAFAREPRKAQEGGDAKH